jgi:hypothetical protein
MTEEVIMSLVLELVRPNKSESSSTFSNEKALQIRVQKNASTALQLIRLQSSPKTIDSSTYKVLP